MQPEIPAGFDSRQVVARDGAGGGGGGMITVVRNPDQVLPYCVLAFKRGSLSVDYKPPNIPKQASTSSPAAPANNAPSPAAVAGTQQQQQMVHENAAESKCQNPEDISDRKDQNRHRGKYGETD